ncbi:hypothetical protein BDR26DRAFT_914844 [Obelidium mucronatum]|nr:hypothetical protein BDR26DRAFT_914844 [Obelidium mucronatum]
MLLSIISVVASLATTVTALATPPAGENFVGAYVLFGDPAKLKLLADNAATIPVNRIFLSFVRPDMYYIPGSNTLIGAGLNYNNTQADYGFAEVKKYTETLQKNGVEVFLSMGGWDYNCWPYAYAKYSINDYGSTTPTYQSTIQKYAGGDINKCDESNQYCWACEPPTNGNKLEDFTIFPEPGHSETWQQAIAYVEANNKMGTKPIWHPELVGGSKYLANGKAITVPGNDAWFKLKRDPYQDFVLLAKDLGLDGVDIDYEEFWHADMFKVDGSAKNDCGSGCTGFQTVYKFSAIMQNMRINVEKYYPALRVGTAASAAGAWAGTWWGGNLKGLTLNMVPSFPDLVQWIGTGPNAGGWNVMSYDLSKSTVNCPPSPAECDLAGQVDFYMAQYIAAGVSANVGYEIGIPAYPPPSTDFANSLPLLNADAGKILSNVQPYYKAGFFWELFKAQGDEKAFPNVKNAEKHIAVNALAQNLCKSILGAKTPRCSGSVPILANAEFPGTSNVVVITPPNKPKPSGPLPCATPFDIATQYKTGMTLSYKGYNYDVAYWVILGTLPTTPSAGFVQKGLCVASSGSATTTTTTTTTTKVAPTTTTVAPTTTTVAPTTTTKVAPTTTTAAPTTTTTTTTTTAVPTTTTTTTTTTAVPSPTSNVVPCAAAWDASATYNEPRSTVSYQNVNYVNKWWTKGEIPSSSSVWESKGACGSVAGTTTAAHQPARQLQPLLPLPLLLPLQLPLPTTVAAATTTTTAATTTGGSSSIVKGAACSTFGAWECGYACICNYAAGNVLVWECTGVSGC